MTSSEYIDLFLMSQSDDIQAEENEELAIEMSHIISGSFANSLFESAKVADLDNAILTQHYETLFNRNDYYGILYFTIIISDAIGFTLPKEFYLFSLRNELVPILTSAFIEDWMEISEE